MCSLSLVTYPFMVNHSPSINHLWLLFLLKVNNENNEAIDYLCSHDWQKLLEQEPALRQ